MTQKLVQIPEWVFQYQGHKCMCMPLGYRAGLFALKALGVEREKDYGMFLFSELSDEASSGCFDDGLQAATGCTTGKDLFSRLNYGKLSATLYKPGHGAIRMHVKDDYLERLINKGAKFLEMRKSGILPSQIQPEIISSIVEWIESGADDEMFEYERLPNFEYKPVKKSLNRRKCDRCGEYTVEADAKIVGDKFYCRKCYY